MTNQGKRLKATFTPSQYQYLKQQSEQHGLSLAQMIAVCVDACQRQQVPMEQLYGAVMTMTLHLASIRAQLERWQGGEIPPQLALDLRGIDLEQLLKQSQQLQRQWLGLKLTTTTPEDDLNQSNLEIADDDY